MNILENIIAQAKQSPRRIVLPEGENERTLQAAVRIHQDKIAEPILLGNQATITQQANNLNLDLSGILVIDPTTSEWRDELAGQLFELRQKKGVTREQAGEMITQPLWFGSMLVKTGRADGSVAGAIHTTADVVRTALQAFGVKPGAKLVSSFFLMILDQPHHPIQGGMIFSDCALAIEPDSEQLAEIALASAENARSFLQEEPRVAMLSFSTSGSGKHAQVDKVTEAAALVREQAPDLLLDGEVQFDAAFVPEIAERKVKNSQLNGRANVMIFPSLEAANIGYKIAERIGGAKAVGPFLQGLNKPANDLSRGCSVDDIYNTVATTVIQAQQQTQ